MQNQFPSNEDFARVARLNNFYNVFKGLHSKVFSEESSGGTLFSLESLPEAGLETRISWLCHLIVAAEAGGLRYGLRLGEQLISLNRGAAHRHRCLSGLALYR